MSMLGRRYYGEMEGALSVPESTTSVSSVDLQLTAANVEGDTTSAFARIPSQSLDPVLT